MSARDRVLALWTERGWAMGVSADAGGWRAWAKPSLREIHEGAGPTEEAACEALLAKLDLPPSDLEHAWRCERASRIELQRLLGEARSAAPAWVWTGGEAHEPLRCVGVGEEVDFIHKGRWTLRLPPLPESKP